jgi:hypothetical protein
MRRAENESGAATIKTTETVKEAAGFGCFLIDFLMFSFMKESGIINAEPSFIGSEVRCEMPKTVKIDFDKEIAHRKRERQALQVKLDQEELERRESAVQSGHSHLISAEEFWNNVEKAGF